MHFNYIIVNKNGAIDELPVESDDNFTGGQRIVMQILAEPQFCLQRRVITTLQEQRPYSGIQFLLCLD
jgi:hypothetical protein